MAPEVNTTAASSRGRAGRERRARGPAARATASVASTPSSRARAGGIGPTAKRRPPIRRARAATRPAVDGDEVLRPGPAQRPRQPAGAQPGVGDDDHGADPPARVDDRGQVGTGRHEQRDPLARAGPRPRADPAARSSTRRASGAQVIDRRRPPARRRRLAGGAGSAARRSSAAPSGAPVGGRRARRRLRRRRRAEPCRPTHVRRRRRRGVLGDQVGGALVAVDVRVREPVDEVPQVAVGEHRVATAPQPAAPARRGRVTPAAIRVERRHGRGGRPRAGCRRRSRRRRSAVGVA